MENKAQREAGTGAEMDEKDMVAKRMAKDTVF